MPLVGAVASRNGDSLYCINHASIPTMSVCLFPEQQVPGVSWIDSFLASPHSSFPLTYNTVMVS